MATEFCSIHFLGTECIRLAVVFQNRVDEYNFRIWHLVSQCCFSVCVNDRGLDERLKTLNAEYFLTNLLTIQHSPMSIPNCDQADFYYSIVITFANCNSVEIFGYSKALGKALKMFLNIEH